MQRNGMNILYKTDRKETSALWDENLIESFAVLVDALKIHEKATIKHENAEPLERRQTCDVM